MTRRTAFFTIALTAGLSGVAHAQKSGDDDVPKAYRPPPGMCRIWIENDYVEKGKKPEAKEIPFLRKFTDDKKKSEP
jgi:hypothetical protein